MFKITLNFTKKLLSPVFYVCPAVLTVYENWCTFSAVGYSDGCPGNKLVFCRSSNIFGGAKPIDTSAREREMEEKIAAQKEERL